MFTMLVQERSKQAENQFRELVKSHAEALETFANNIGVIKKAAMDGLNEALTILDSNQNLAIKINKDFVEISHEALETVVNGIDSARNNVMKLFFGEYIDMNKLFGDNQWRRNPFTLNDE